MVYLLDKFIEFMEISEIAHHTFCAGAKVESDQHNNEILASI